MMTGELKAEFWNRRTASNDFARLHVWSGDLKGVECNLRSEQASSGISREEHSDLKSVGQCSNTITKPGIWVDSFSIGIEHDVELATISNHPFGQD
jgi:hypothetical protein